MGACSCINKVFLFSLNFIVFTIGITVIALASVVIHRGSEYQSLLFEGILTLPLWTLLVGIGITILGFFGCCGAVKEDKCMLYTYASVVSVLFIAEIVLGILVALYPEKAADEIKKGMTNAFYKYDSNDTALDNAIDSMQHESECCGVEGYEDWYQTPYGIVPQTCYKDMSDYQPGIKPDTEDVYDMGCFEVIKEDLKSVTLALGITAIILALVQVFCISVACGLARKRSMYV